MFLIKANNVKPGRVGVLWTILQFAFALVLAACSSSGGTGSTSPPPTSASPLDTYQLTGDVQFVHDPSIYKQGNDWYIFSTDIGATGNHLPIRCSSDLKSFHLCGYVFPTLPNWIPQRFPSLTDLWAPEVAHFGGKYHLYYAASVFGTNNSVIALASNTTLDPSDPQYQWVDEGEVVSTSGADDYNAIDPSILVESDGSVWLTFGSYWAGIKQRRLDPVTGKLSTADMTLYALASRPGSTAIEASSLVKHNGYYYLFVSFDTCCLGANSTYRIMVGRSSSLHGPYIDESGTPMLQGGGTQLLAGKSPWAGPGGETAFLDAESSIIVFHAYAISDGTPWLHVNSLSWRNDWPVIQ